MGRWIKPTSTWAGRVPGTSSYTGILQRCRSTPYGGMTAPTSQQTGGDGRAFERAALPTHVWWPWRRPLRGPSGGPLGEPSGGRACRSARLSATLPCWTCSGACGCGGALKSPWGALESPTSLDLLLGGGLKGGPCIPRGRGPTWGGALREAPEASLEAALTVSKGQADGHIRDGGGGRGGGVGERHVGLVTQLPSARRRSAEKRMQPGRLHSGGGGDAWVSRRSCRLHAAAVEGAAEASACEAAALRGRTEAEARQALERHPSRSGGEGRPRVPPSPPPNFA